MATRAEIKDVLYNGLVTASSGMVPPEHVKLYYTSDEESPSIVWRETYRTVPINEASGSPDHVEYSGGQVQYEEYREYREAIYTIRIREGDEASLEDIYEAVHKYFGKYEHTAWDVHDLHSDIYKIDISDTFDSDDRTADNVYRTDVLEVRIHFYRTYEYTDDNITSFDMDVEGTQYTSN